MYTLYYSPGAASFAVHWMLIHIGAPFELVRIDLASKQQHSAQYLALNPNGHVPTMIVDGSPAAECGALLMALSERYPEAGLSRKIDDGDRMEYLQTMFYLANTLQPAFRNWFYPDEAAGAEPVIFAFMHANGTSRLWLTWIADMHWPRFLKPAQASFRSVPAGRRPLDWSFEVNLLSSFVFLLRSVVGELAAPFVDPFTLL